MKMWKSTKISPANCCEVGSCQCQVPMPLNGRSQGIDFCVADIVAAFNAANIKTVASCCGHGSMPGIISLEDGRELKVNNHIIHKDFIERKDEE